MKTVFMPLLLFATCTYATGIICVNGKCTPVSDNRKISGIVVHDGRITINGKSFGNYKEGAHITIKGDVGSIQADGGVTCEKAGTVSSNGSVNVKEVGGNVEANGSVTAVTIKGSVEANGPVTYHNK